MSSIFRTILITLLLSSTILAAEKGEIFNQDALVLKQDVEVVTDNVKSFLSTSNSQKVKVWVFFTDKAVFDKSSFSSKAVSINLSEKVLKRRKKVELDHVTFVDLPVEKSYVQQIVNTGAKHRRSSKWLNAASFEIDFDQLDQIAELPFVKSVKPMAGFKKDQPQLVAPSLDKLAPSQSLAPDALNYGGATDQLNQINVPSVHEKGYTGSGVTLCITDTGFRKSHEAFAKHYLDGRVLAEYDFVFDDAETANEPLDWASQWNHGTYIWSVSGGNLDGSIYGPAYNANFLLAKTEDVRSETQVEEDNWIAALEWADSLGADVITTSLGYSDWYTSADYDGNTAPITLAANTCASLGIILCNSMGNSGPAATTLSPPADAFDILAVGAVASNGTIASFSSRGPTADGRVKPEVCARGVATYSASATSDNSYDGVNGTSLSTPLVAGAACLMVEARPTFPPTLIRQALMETADNSISPNNTYGWGVIDVDAAIGWGINIAADNQSGDGPMSVNFSGSSPLSATSWFWDFGDGNNSTDQNPSHTYTQNGVFDVSLTIDSPYGPLTKTESAYIFVFGDTLTFVSDSAFAGNQVVMSVDLKNSQPLREITIPFKFVDVPSMTFDSVTRGSRTSYFESFEPIFIDTWTDTSKYTYLLKANNGGGSPDLPIGEGQIMKLYFSFDQYQLGGTIYPVDSNQSIQSQFNLKLLSPYLTYTPVFTEGYVKTTDVIRGDLDYNQTINISDAVFMINYSFSSGPAPNTIQAYDVDANLLMNVTDINYLIAYMFNGGPAPVTP